MDSESDSESESGSGNKPLESSQASAILMPLGHKRLVVLL